jgi:hypothetical protein
MLKAQLDALSQTPYFSEALNEYLEGLIGLSDSVLTTCGQTPDQVTRAMSRMLWMATKYLYGSTSNQIPYEAVYGLGRALRDWIAAPCEITTALIYEPNYYFQAVSLSDLAKQYWGVEFKTTLVHIALPSLYRHRPLYHVALYHELGHFIDNQLKISEYTLLTNPVPPAALSSELNHRMEFFADLLAASYTGKAIRIFLEQFAPGAPVSATHPSMKDRLDTIDAFLAGEPAPALDIFQSALSGRGLPMLSKRYIAPDVKSCFWNIRPYRLETDEEVHGILESGWSFLNEPDLQNAMPWSGFDTFDAETIVNDLIEKSVRNRMIVARWSSGTA